MGCLCVSRGRRRASTQEGGRRPTDCAMRACGRGAGALGLLPCETVARQRPAAPLPSLSLFSGWLRRWVYRSDSAKRWADAGGVQLWLFPCSGWLGLSVLFVRVVLPDWLAFCCRGGASWCYTFACSFALFRLGVLFVIAEGKTRVIVTLDDELISRMDDWCEKNHMTRSGLVTYLMNVAFVDSGIAPERLAKAFTRMALKVAIDEEVSARLAALNELDKALGLA